MGRAPWKDVAAVFLFFALAGDVHAQPMLVDPVLQSGPGESAEGVCHVKADLTLSEADSLVSLEVDAEALANMAEQYPIAASMIAVLHSTGDPLPVLERLNEFQIQFPGRPVAQSASDYFRKTSSAAGENLPAGSDVLTTAKSSQRGSGTVLLEIQSELRSDKGTNLAIEGPVYVELARTGERSDYEYGNVTIHPPVLRVVSISGMSPKNGSSED